MSGLTAPIITLTKEEINAFKGEACVANKQTRPSFPNSSTRFGKGKCLHIDLCGPLRAERPDGEFYILSVIDDGTRYGAALLGEAQDISHMQPFGTVCYVLRLPRHQREAGKLSPVSDKGILVGYSQDSKAYRVLMDTGKVVESRDVSFLPTTHQVPTAAGTSQSMIDFDVGGDDFTVVTPPHAPPTPSSQQLEQEEHDVHDEQTEVPEPEGTAPTPATTLKIRGRSNKGQPPERYVAMKAKTVQQRVVMH
ncbi:hypothetical protein CEUSTIGMA_g11587.t1 [Chlamydomonas eustigma]|uniref:Retroviral polymerase SH3-like domain-containing protein n=1 Tax=Chlamydomonas eustigma TaxID=1157962 RepID=A0A250XM54_9CHLO|nr:hypothetical protein CEUSTIGMA_g11587.t1 [Chlamydomonas eustigma]|eukprot:GAX84164.1 hypothetical protein CEUSTIGMA_g11587.t1 [Chlamydomonas eustigma]